MLRISVVVITYNEEKNLARCLDSVKGVADEVVVVDSSSTDATVDIAKLYNAIIVDRPFDGYAKQKNFATSRATNDWILSLDADEQLTPELKSSILAVKNGPAHNVYKLARLTNYCGQWIRHCGWYPDHQTRLFDRTKGSWQELNVHEFWKAHDPSEKTGLLQGDLLHYSFTSIDSHYRKIEKYTELAAQEAVANGKSASLFKTLISPAWHFVSEYFFKLGFLDGYYGFVICRLSAYTAYVKYSKIRRYSRK